MVGTRIGGGITDIIHTISSHTIIVAHITATIMPGTIMPGMPGTITMHTQRLTMAEDIDKPI